MLLYVIEYSLVVGLGKGRSDLGLNLLTLELVLGFGRAEFKHLPITTESGFWTELTEILVMEFTIFCWSRDVGFEFVVAEAPP